MNEIYKIRDRLLNRLLFLIKSESIIYDLTVPEYIEYCNTNNERVSFNYDKLPVKHHKIENGNVIKFSDFEVSTKEKQEALKKVLKYIQEPPSLEQRIKDLKEKHKKVDEENQKRINQVKAIEALSYLIASMFGIKTKYDLTGVIRIPKTY